jgi:transposase-like protein
MSKTDELNNATFQDEAKAREWLEAQLWADGPVCGHCGTLNEATAISTRPGWYQCNACRKQFSVTVGTLFERSHIPLNKWLMAAFLICASKKGLSTHQLHRMLGVSYKSMWFMMHRIREAMRESNFPPLGGAGKFVEADETFTGGKAKNRAYKEPPPKEAVMALVERGGKVHSYHVPEVTAATLKPIIVDAIAKDSHFRTDESSVYWLIGEQFSSHRTVTHSINEYVRGDAHTQHHRRLLLHPEARHLWNLSSRLARPSEALPRRIRFPIQLPYSARLYRSRARDDRVEGHRRKETDLSADW